MAKSIRSKCKRKARTELRRTIGEDFHKKKMAEVQDKLKECVEKQSLKSLDKLANVFDAAQEETLLETMDTTTVNTTTIGIEAVDDDIIAAKELKGENKAPPARKAKRSRKHGLQAAQKKERADRPRPKYFVQF